MSAAQHLQPMQLQMFMSAREIKSQYKTNPAEPQDGESEEDMWYRKNYESWERNITPSVKKFGVKEPVRLADNRGLIADGYHRVAASEEVDADRLMPVIHHDTLRAAVRAKIFQPGTPDHQLDEPSARHARGEI